MRYWLARALHKLGYWIYEEPADEAEQPEIQYIVDLGPYMGVRPPPSEPIDFETLWRGQVYDGSFYNEEEDVYRPGIYL